LKIAPIFNRNHLASTKSNQVRDQHGSTQWLANGVHPAFTPDHHVIAVTDIPVVGSIITVRWNFDDREKKLKKATNGVNSSVNTGEWNVVWVAGDGEFNAGIEERLNERKRVLLVRVK
jgi:hypothetical protein